MTRIAPRTTARRPDARTDYDGFVESHRKPAVGNPPDPGHSLANW